MNIIGVKSFTQQEGKSTAMRTRRVFADMIVNISARVEGKLPDWPPMLQDRVYKEIEARSKLANRNWQHFNSKCDEDGGVPFIHVILYADVPLQ